mgnify:CR=1 FL=1
MMDKQDVINKIKGMTVETFFSGSLFVSQPKVIELVKQIKEPYKPIIPWYIAEWIEKAKSDDDYNVVDAVNEAPQGEVSDWLILENVNTFAKAWVNGYEVEKETKYIVKIKANKETPDYLVDTGTNGLRFYNNLYTQNRKHTRKELEEAGFGWVFNCEGIEIEEAE